MANSWEAPELEGMIDSIPVEVDPFAYIVDTRNSWIAATASEYTTAILITFLVFHALVFAVCMFVLTMSCIPRAQQAPWLVKKLYIRDKSGQIVYKTPLYFLNAGILSALLQLICSTASAAYIGIQMQSARLITAQLLHAKILPVIATMFAFETFSHWSLTHCFFVTLYFSRQVNKEINVGTRRLISPSIVINLFFMGFPACVAVMVTVTASWTTIHHHRFAVETLGILEGLRQGSLVWKKLHGGSHLSRKERSRISFELDQIVSTLKKNYIEIVPHVKRLCHALNVGTAVMLLIACTTCAVFLSVFCLLIKEYPRSVQQRSSCTLILPPLTHSENWLKTEAIGNPRRIGFMSVFWSRIRILMMNKQFFCLLLRAIGVFLSILSQCITLITVLLKSNEVLMVKYLADASTWVVIGSGAWSAVPIVWQCWKMYAERSKDHFCSFSPSESNLSATNDMKHNTQSHQTGDLELEIKLPEKVHEIPNVFG